MSNVARLTEISPFGLASQHVGVDGVVSESRVV